MATVQTQRLLAYNLHSGVKMEQKLKEWPTNVWSSIWDPWHLIFSNLCRQLSITVIRGASSSKWWKLMQGPTAPSGTWGILWRGEGRIVGARRIKDIRRTWQTESTKPGLKWLTDWISSNQEPAWVCAGPLHICHSWWLGDAASLLKVGVGVPLTHLSPVLRTFLLLLGCLAQP